MAPRLLKNVCSPDERMLMISIAGEAPVPIAVGDASQTKSGGINDDDVADDKDVESKVLFGLKRREN